MLLYITTRQTNTSNYDFVESTPNYDFVEHNMQQLTFLSGRT